MEKQLINLTIFLMKDDVADMGDCLKEPYLDSTPLKQELGLEGKIYYSKSTKNPPRWKFHLDEFASTKIPMLDNISNKAVMIVKMKQRFLAIVFGHGRSFLKEECIERNFGLRVALNTIDPNKMRSVNAATIEDMVVNLVNQPFFNRVNDFILSMVKVSKVSLPNCASDEKEGPYNERVAKSSPDYCLFDKKLNSVEYGPKSVEACDLFTKNKQFIHVKNRGYSSQLSHLFAQGRVSAECFASDESFRKQVSNKAKRRFGVELFDPSKKLQSDEFEVVYAIIHKKTENLISTLPFFSKVNLMMTAQELDRMHYKYSICPVQKEANKK